MSKSIKMLAAVSLLTLSLFAVPAFAEEPQPQAQPLEQQENGQSSIKQASAALTDQQKQELAAIYRDMFEKKKLLIAKYLEFGLITQEKANKWTEHMEERFAKMEQNGFVPQFRDCKKGKREKARD